MKFNADDEYLARVREIEAQRELLRRNAEEEAVAVLARAGVKIGDKIRISKHYTHVGKTFQIVGVYPGGTHLSLKLSLRLILSNGQPSDCLTSLNLWGDTEIEVVE